MIYTDDKLRLLVALCWCLSDHHGGQPFYLATRKAADVIQTNAMDVSRRMKVLAFDRILERIEAGSLRGRQAAQYRWIGGEVLL